MKWSNKKKRIRIHRILCGLLAALLVLQGIPVRVTAAPAQEPESERILYIRTVQDFLSFAKACQDADYSVDLQVSLQEDIDLTVLPEGEEFKGIGSFSGHFRGNYHTISGMHFTEGAEAIGLFCYLEQGGKVQDLRVKGTIECSDSKVVAGGIAGINAGTIQGCYFKGTVSSLGETGGIAGKNGSSASIVRSSTSGAIDGLRKVGGIAGENRGVITDCSNAAAVNADTKWLDFEGDEELSLSATGIWDGIQEKLVEGTDFGGIAGWSSGIIAGCTNKAVIGYQHAGKNVGGIVGMQSGQVIRCVNAGRVYGKLDVGGIAGQHAPTLTREDAEELAQKVTELHDLMDQMIVDMEGMSDTLHGDFQDISGATRETGDTADALLVELRQVVEQNVAVINELANRIDYCITHFSAAMEDLNQASLQGNALINDLDVLKDTLDIAKELEDKQHDTQLVEEMQSVLSLSSQIRSILTRADGSTKRPDELSVEEIKTVIELLPMLKRQVDEAGNVAEETVVEAGAMAKQADTYGREALDRAKKTMEQASKDALAMKDSLQAAGKELQGIVEYLNALSKLRAVNLSSDFDQNSEKLKTQLDQMSDLMSRLEQHSYLHSEKLEEDLRAVNDKMNEVLMLLVNKLDTIQSMADGENIVVDLSAQEPDDLDASRLTGCTNKGVVNGDRNAGGIVGTVGIEKVDGEQDKKILVGEKYYAHTVVADCDNQGFITVKTENGGGVVGNLELGYVYGCLTAGRVQGAEADYLGGIAGTSQGSIVSCSSMAVLDGRDYLGGIAGQATSVRECFSMVTVLGSNEWVGAIVGRQAFDEKEEDVTILRMLTKEKMSGNYYCSSSLYGVNGVSISGAAQAVSYQELLALEGIPEAFSELTVTFIDEDQNVLQKEVLPYGYDLAKLSYPAIKTESGEYMDWKGLVGETLEGNLVLQALEMTNVTILSGASQGKERPVALAEGAFTEKSRLRAEEYPGTAPADVPDGSICHFYKITLENTSLGQESVTRVRLLNEEDGEAHIYRLDDGKWTKLDQKTLGSYEEVRMKGTEAVFCVAVTKREINWLLIYIASGVGIALLALLTVTILVRRKKRKRMRVWLEKEERIAENAGQKEGDELQ